MSDDNRPCVLLLEPHISLRRALDELLTNEGYDVISCDSLEHVIQRAALAQPCRVALVAWQAMEGLLADEHRHHLVQLTSRLQLVLMVPRRWKRLLQQSDLGFVEMVAKPFDAEELLQSVRSSLERMTLASA